MRLLICGSRDYTDEGAIEYELREFPPDTVVIHGGARGADRMAGEIARRLGMAVEEYPADWAKHGKAAGPIRNAQMLKEGKPDMVLAFFLDNAMSSRGTANMVEQALAAGVSVTCVVPGDDGGEPGPGDRRG